MWSNVHNSLITAIRDYLTPQLRPRYFVAVKERSYLDDATPGGFMAVPDVGVIGLYSSQPVAVLDMPTALTEPQVIEMPMREQIRETYLSIQEVGTSDIATEMWLDGEDGLKVVTILEILSPWNKGSREGRAQYTRKRDEIINSYTNLVEIDLLRAGRGFVIEQHDQHHYNLLVSAAPMRPRAHFYPFTVRQPIPTFRLPLQEDDEWPVLDLNTILHELYDRAGYDLRIDYRVNPVPAFTGDDTQWVEQSGVETILRNVELR